MEVAIFWDPVPVHPDLYANLEAVKHIREKKSTDPSDYRVDHAAVLVKVPADGRWYQVGRVRTGEAASLRSRWGRGLYGYIEVSSWSAENLNSNSRAPDEKDHKLIYVKRLSNG